MDPCAASSDGCCGRMRATRRSCCRSTCQGRPYACRWTQQTSVRTGNSAGGPHGDAAALPGHCLVPREDWPPLQREGMGAWHERQLQRRGVAASVPTGHHCERHLQARASRWTHPALRRARGGHRARAAKAVGRNAPARRGRPPEKGRGGPAHALGLEHGPVRAPRRGGRPAHHGLRDAQGAAGRDVARASGVDPDPGKRPEHSAPRPPRRRDARSLRGRPRVPAAAPRTVYLGRDARGGGAARGDPRIPVRGHRSHPGGRSGSP